MLHGQQACHPTPYYYRLHGHGQQACRPPPHYYRLLTSRALVTVCIEKQPVHLAVTGATQREAQSPVYPRKIHPFHTAEEAPL